VRNPAVGDRSRKPQAAVPQKRETERSISAYALRTVLGDPVKDVGAQIGKLPWASDCPRPPLECIPLAPPTTPPVAAYFAILNSCQRSHRWGWRHLTTSQKIQNKCHDQAQK
jgi:hypothetical protein